METAYCCSAARGNVTQLNLCCVLFIFVTYLKFRPPVFCSTVLAMKEVEFLVCVFFFFCSCLAN